MKGSIQKRIGKTGTSYRARVDLGEDPVSGERRQRAQSFPTRKAAEAAIAKWIHQINTGSAIEVSKMTLGELLTSWLAMKRHTVRVTTIDTYTATINKHIRPVLGSVPAQKLTTGTVQDFYSRLLNAGTGARTVQLCHLRLSQALDYGVKTGVVFRNVVDTVEPPRVVTKPGKTWTGEEARRFLTEATTDLYGAYWWLILLSGLRRGEALGLRWQDVNVPASTVRVAQQVVIHNGAPRIQEPKSRAAGRIVKLPAEAMATLKTHRAKQNAARLMLGDLWNDHDLVFCTGDGKPLNPNNLYRHFNAIVKAADVPEIRIHDLRHTHATLLLASGRPIKAVSERLGHAKSSITVDTYMHALPDMQDQTADAVSTLFFGEPVNESQRA